MGFVLKRSVRKWWMEKVTFELNETGGAGTRHTVVLKMSPNTGNHECKDSAKRAVAREAERDGWDSRLEFEVMQTLLLGHWACCICHAYRRNFRKKLVSFYR